MISVCVQLFKFIFKLNDQLYKSLNDRIFVFLQSFFYDMINKD